MLNNKNNKRCYKFSTVFLNHARSNQKSSDCKKITYIVTKHCLEYLFIFYHQQQTPKKKSQQTSKRQSTLFLILELPQIITTSVPVLQLQNREHVLPAERALCSLSGKVSWAWPGCSGWVWVVNPYQHPGRCQGRNHSQKSQFTHGNGEVLDFLLSFSAPVWKVCQVTKRNTSHV